AARARARTRGPRTPQRGGPRGPRPPPRLITSEGTPLPPQDPVATGDRSARDLAVPRPAFRPHVIHRAVREDHGDDLFRVTNFSGSSRVRDDFCECSHADHLLVHLSLTDRQAY